MKGSFCKQAHVRFCRADGVRFELVHGDLIGRMWSAALPIDDGRVSEAHAMVSLREQTLRLIALRGGLGLKGKAVKEVNLEAGQEIILARGLVLKVEAVHLPQCVLGLEGDNLTRQTLPSVSSLIMNPTIRLASGYLLEASAWIWFSGENWRLKQGVQGPVPFKAGDEFKLGVQSFRGVDISLAAAGQAPTLPHGSLVSPLRIVANFNTVHIFRGDELALVLAGLPARIVSELAALGGPAPWKYSFGL